MGRSDSDSDRQPADFAGKKVGVWAFGNEYEVIAAARKAGLEPERDYTKVDPVLRHELVPQREIDAAKAMIYNEYAQVLEATNPDTGELYQPEDLNVINYNDVGTAMLQDAIWARAAWLAEEGNEDIATRFLAASFEGWKYCRDNPEACVQIVLDNGSILGAGHQAWMMNEINALGLAGRGRHRRDAGGDLGPTSDRAGCGHPQQLLTLGGGPTWPRQPVQRSRATPSAADFAKRHGHGDPGRRSRRRPVFRPTRAS